MYSVVTVVTLCAIVASWAFADAKNGATGCAPPLGLLIRAADVNQNGEVTLVEFLAKFPNASKDRSNVLDRNDDGVLTRADVPWEQRRQILQKLKRADTDGDGRVS